MVTECGNLPHVTTHYQSNKMTRVYEHDTVEDMAQKIFRQFEVMQSCKVEGFIPDMINEHLHEKGKLVWERIIELDRQENFEAHVKGGSKRKRTVYENSNGAALAHKIFRWSREFRNNKLVYTIWRMQ